MELKLANLEKIKKIIDKVPNFSIEELSKKTIEDPKWIAFGTGNIFRAYIARVAQDLVEIGEFDRGINVIESMDDCLIKKAYIPNDNLALSVTLKTNQKLETQLIGSISEAIYMRENFERMEKIFKNKNLQIASYTITEKGYDIFDNKGNIRENILKDLENAPHLSNNLMVNSVGFLYIRYKENLPLTMLSIDNLSKNGDVLKNQYLHLLRYM